ncbi:MAG: alanine racemase [Pseudomonadota bacterium]
MTNRHGSSYYLLDVAKVKANIAHFESAFLSRRPNTIFSYSYKTNYIPQVCKAIRAAGWLAEVVSEMEFDFALNFGNEAERIIVNGPIKSRQQLERYLKAGSIVHLDSAQEVRDVLEISELLEKKARVGVRCNFSCGEAVSRFGIDAESDELAACIQSLLDHGNVEIVGLHCHFPNRDLASYKVRAESMAKIFCDFPALQSCYIDIGGGFFGNMPESLANQFADEVPTFDQYAEAISTVLDHTGLVDVPILLEPGSAIVADSMQFAAQIQSVKEIRGKTFATVAGSRFNLGSFASKLNLPLTIFGSSENPRTSRADADIVGFTCIEGDVLFRGFEGEFDVGDIAVFDNVGSYSYVFKPPFIRPNSPILVYDSSVESSDVAVSKRRELPEDILATFEEF